ncbi:carbon-nitrogen hydrolase family protein [Muricoccus radiodurans]|uniref:carbon-nitrogen hydrolase family protein n=1 Tax=Muricoccus radiodurans TaxID=2231721 RepID=UPI003CF1B214
MTPPPARPVRVGALAYGVTRIASLDDWAAKLDALVAKGADGADLLVMPEYAPMEVAAALGANADAAAELDAVCDVAPALLDTMRDVARHHGVWLLPGTLPFRGTDGTVRNRAPLIGADGAVTFQDKRVMTRFETESWGVRPGEPPAVFDTPWGRIGIAVCYDAEFPDLVRAAVRAGAWLVLVPSCTDTPQGFNRVWLSARARALENQCYVAVSPTVGDAPWLAALDENRGRAAILGPVDRGFPENGVIAQGPSDAPGWVFATLDPAALDRARADGAVRNHRDWPGPVSDPIPLRPENPR